MIKLQSYIAETIVTYTAQQNIDIAENSSLTIRECFNFKTAIDRTRTERKVGAIVAKCYDNNNLGNESFSFSRSTASFPITCTSKVFFIYLQ